MKKLIIDAALRMFVEDGYEKTSIRNIADKIEYSPGTIYLYYKDKDELLYAVQKDGRGKGIGKQLIMAASEKGKREGLAFAGLLVSTSNPDAQRLYERLGFGVVRTVAFSGGFYYHLQKLL